MVATAAVGRCGPGRLKRRKPERTKPHVDRRRTRPGGMKVLVFVREAPSQGSLRTVHSHVSQLLGDVAGARTPRTELMLLHTAVQALNVSVLQIMEVNVQAEGRLIPDALPSAPARRSLCHTRWTFLLLTSAPWWT